MGDPSIDSHALSRKNVRRRWIATFPFCSGIEMQSHKIRFIIIALLCLGVTIASVVTFFSRPAAVPTHLAEADGTVEKVDATQRKGRLQSVNFILATGGDAFEYSSVLPGIDAVWGRLKVGSPVHVTFDDADSKRSIWGMRLGDDVVVTPEQALHARRKNGQIGAMIGLIALLGAGYFLHRARKA
ncbi:hypothetical protein [Xanthomonas sacchari]|uniref:hypothetical protein n=1 Tax=Xanthomonas sacchari TaxID=56458 RepID=UPI0022586847|nr:hypothetical protein [Xanthomonas sacchari]